MVTVGVKWSDLMGCGRLATCVKCTVKRSLPLPEEWFRKRFGDTPYASEHSPMSESVTTDKTHSEYEESACPSDSRHSSGRPFPPLRANFGHEARMRLRQRRGWRM